MNYPPLSYYAIGRQQVFHLPIFLDGDSYDENGELFQIDYVHQAYRYEHGGNVGKSLPSGYLQPSLMRWVRGAFRPMFSSLSPFNALPNHFDAFRLMQEIEEYSDERQRKQDRYRFGILDEVSLISGTKPEDGARWRALLRKVNQNWKDREPSRPLAGKWFDWYAYEFAWYHFPYSSTTEPWYGVLHLVPEWKPTVSSFSSTHGYVYNAVGGRGATAHRQTGKTELTRVANHFYRLIGKTFQYTPMTEFVKDTLNNYQYHEIRIMTSMQLRMARDRGGL